MKNPLSSSCSEKDNKHLVQKTLAGDKQALEELIRLHQPFIYNVAWKMVHDPDDAKDLAQEVFIKVITKLSQFNFKSSFRTWLYRIVANEFLQSKRSEKRGAFSSFEEYGRRLEAIPNPDLNEEEKISLRELSREMQVKCMSGMLMCLTPEQRLIYLLGDTFGLNHNLGAEIFNISKQNFRVKLHRARIELYNYMNGKCGLVNKKNPCRCPKKAKALKEKGILDEREMRFNISTHRKVLDYVEKEHEYLQELVEEKYTDLFRDHPTKDNFDKDTILEEIFGDGEIMKHLNYS